MVTLIFKDASQNQIPGPTEPKFEQCCEALKAYRANGPVIQIFHVK